MIAESSDDETGDNSLQVSCSLLITVLTLIVVITRSARTHLALSTFYSRNHG